MDYTVGELAKQAGLTVRALHHYEKLGLVPPSGRSEAGYRRYNEADVLRLHRVLAYRQMGLGLKEIAPLLAGEPAPLQEVLAQQIAAARTEIGRQQRLLEALEDVAARAATGSGDLAAQLLVAMSKMRLFEKYFNAEELQGFHDKRQQLGGEELRRIEAQWPQLIAAMTQAMEQGVDPGSEPVLAMMRHWVALTERFIDGNDALRPKIRAMYAAEPGLRTEMGFTPELIAYLQQATEALRAAPNEQGVAP